MNTNQVVRQVEGHLTYLKEMAEKLGYDEFYISRIAECEVVINGQLIHVQDDRWSWEAAFPVIAEFKIDGWEFTIRGHDEKYMIPSNGPAEWIVARLVDFTRGDYRSTHSGRCIDCEMPASAGYVKLITPSGRKFSAGFRTECGCRAGGPDPDEAKLSYRLSEAAKLLASYVGELSETVELKSAVFAWLDKKEGSVGQLKQVGRNIRMIS